MNSTEALDCIANIQYDIGSAKYPELWHYVQALSEISDYIIDSSKQIPRVKNLIDRQQAIDALIERDPNCGIDSAEVIKELPPAQPDLDEWCTDCKEYDSEKHCCPRFNRVIRQAIKDAQLERKEGQ